MCMIFNPIYKHKTVCCTFHEFTLNGACLNYVSEFKYLGHMIINSLCDSADVQREIRCVTSYAASVCATHPLTRQLDRLRQLWFSAAMQQRVSQSVSRE